MIKIKNLFAVAALVAGAVPAMAAMTTIDISAFANTSWNEAQPTGTMTGNTGTTFAGVTFDILPTSGNNIWVGSPEASSIVIPINIQGASTVYTLLNSWWGQSSWETVSVQFNDSAGASQSFTLYGNTDIRDVLQNSYTNDINGTTTQEWLGWNNGDNRRLRFDAQAFTLDAAFASQTLTDMVVTAINPGDMVSEPILSAVTVVSNGAAVPEPATLAMLLPGLGMLGWVSRRRRQAPVRDQKQQSRMA